MVAHLRERTLLVRALFTTPVPAIGVRSTVTRPEVGRGPAYRRDVHPQLEKLAVLVLVAGCRRPIVELSEAELPRDVPG